jgi:arsenite oxidase small subunit
MPAEQRGPTTPSQEFPIETAEEPDVGRRQFLSTLAVASGAFACAHAGIALRSVRTAGREPLQHEPRDLGVNFYQMAIGDAVAFKYPDKQSPCLLVKLGDQPSDLVAYSQSCTHLMCPVVPEPDKNRLFCPCHQGAFDIRTGDAIMGPPRAPLPKITIAIATDGAITATGVQRGGSDQTDKIADVSDPGVEA